MQSTVKPTLLRKKEVALIVPYARFLWKYSKQNYVFSVIWRNYVISLG